MLPEGLAKGMRRTLLLLTMVVGVALVVWAGWQNWRAAHRAIPIAMIQPMQAPAAQQGEAKGATTNDAAAGVSGLRGKQAPAFSLVDLDGKRVSLGDFKGHPLLINYWATYCGPCQVEMPWIEDLSRKYAATGFEVVGITYDAEVGKATIARAAKGLGVTYPILLSDAATEKAYLNGIEVLPMSFYVDRVGKIIEVSPGQGSKEDLEAMVKETVAAGN